MAEQNFYAEISSTGKTPASRTGKEGLDVTSYTKYGDVEVNTWNAYARDRDAPIDAWVLIKVQPHHGSSQDRRLIYHGKLTPLLENVPLNIIRYQLSSLTDEQRLELFQDLSKLVVLAHTEVADASP